MPDYNFLPFFLTEPVYIIPEPALELETQEKEPHNDLSDQTALGIQPEIKELIIKSRGGFKKNILILVDDPFPEVLNITDTEFLLKILKAIRLSEDDVAIVNVHHLNNDFLPLLKEHFNYRVLMMFGIEAPSITKNITKYKIIESSGEKVLYADSLTDIDKDKQKKLKLWENLQLLFIMK